MTKMLWGGCLVFALGAAVGGCIHTPPQTARAEGYDDSPARSYEELKQERERFGPRGDLNPMLKPGEHPDDPKIVVVRKFRVSFWGPGLVSPKVWEVKKDPSVGRESGVLYVSLDDGSTVTIANNWTVEEL